MPPRRCPHTFRNHCSQDWGLIFLHLHGFWLRCCYIRETFPTTLWKQAAPHSVSLFSITLAPPEKLCTHLILFTLSLTSMSAPRGPDLHRLLHCCISVPRIQHLAQSKYSVNIYSINEFPPLPPSPFPIAHVHICFLSHWTAYPACLPIKGTVNTDSGV